MRKSDTAATGKRLLATALVVTGLVTVAPVSASAGGSPAPRQLYGQTFGLQNYFDTDTTNTDPATLIPSFQHLEGPVDGRVEIDLDNVDYIYGFDIARNSISMSWNPAPEWDVYEPYVGAISGATQEQAAASPIADEYHFTFSQPISGFDVTADPSMPLVPDVFFADDHTLVISVPGGVDIGDGFDALIELAPPVYSIRGLDFDLQNYFDTDTTNPESSTLLPSFGLQTGTVGRGIEVSDYIYDINLRGRSITMRWNPAPAWDVFEPYVGAISGATKEQAAAAPIADEYHFTFSQKVSHLDVTVAEYRKLAPNVYFADDYTLVVSIPGGTDIGDGFNARINIGNR